jgi:erythrin-vacuolar iron transport family protein
LRGELGLDSRVKAALAARRRFRGDRLPGEAKRNLNFMRSFDSLSESEILALAISQEEEDARIYDDIAHGLEAHYPEQAAKFAELRREEDAHRHRLLDVYRARFGDHVPLIRREDVRGFVRRRPVWLARPLGLKAVQRAAEMIEVETKRFYEAAARRATDAGIRQLLGDLAEEERHHARTAGHMAKSKLSDEESARQKRLFVLQVIQPGLAGLMDGSVSTLAPLFAAAFATHDSLDAFRVGLAASFGAGISMGFAEALSDDGSLTGRGHPWLRGTVCGLMTTLGGIGHTLPYLIREVKTATWIAVTVVLCELGIIAWIRRRYMDTPLASAVIQVVLGGVLVFLVGVLIGKS